MAKPIQMVNASCLFQLNIVILSYLPFQMQSQRILAKESYSHTVYYPNPRIHIYVLLHFCLI